MPKELLSAAAIALTFVLFVPYIRSTLRGEIKPHVFSWLIWGLGTFTVFLAQLADGGGVGAWPIGISGLITFYIALLAYLKRGNTHITRSDWGFLAAAVGALPLWVVTADPLWAVVILTFADLVGFGPTVRRGYVDPFAEGAGFFALGALRNLLVVLALEHYTVTTTLFPAAVGAGCLLVSGLLYWRRFQLGGSSAVGS